MVIDPRTLEHLADRPTVTEERPCRRCGYNLVGLPAGVECPECGAPPPTSRRWASEPFTDAPRSYLNRLAAGCWLMALGGGALVAGLVVGHVLLAASAAAVIAACLWVAGVFAVTASRPTRGSVPPPEEMRLRTLSRSTQAAWIVAAIAQSAQHVTPPGGGGFGAATVLAAVVGISTLIGLFGFAAVAASIADLGHWAGETSLAARMRGIAWAVVVCGGYILLASAFIWVTDGIPWLLAVRGVVGFPVFLAWPALVAALLIFFVSLFQLAWMAGWALRNAEAAIQRDERLRRKFRQARSGAPDAGRP